MRRTVALLERRGYALAAERLGAVCLGGPLGPAETLAAASGSADLTARHGLIVSRQSRVPVEAVSSRSRCHPRDAAAYLPATLNFISVLAGCAPFIRSIAIGGSMASGGFIASDDVDLNLIVEDGHRYQAYLVLNLLGFAHALAHRGKPVDVHTRRPLAPRLMTANLVLEVSQCFPLERQDEDMAYELLMSEPVHGTPLFREVVASNRRLLEHFPQLAYKPAPLARDIRPRLPSALFPRFLEGPSRLAGGAAWRYMQWTRRHDPVALGRVAFVRSTMRPYALFDER